MGEWFQFNELWMFVVVKKDTEWWQVVTGHGEENAIQRKF